ncbi:MAG: chromosomal replication initiator protein DnaA [Microbacteriaceae bacterium]|nr:chromosomal replication initiator protein DnaA [Microbacteriaceae bacterium]MCI1207439.1 chromosomal replication initiator protein DnaA [Microbacteriaceae bacterium]
MSENAAADQDQTGWTAVCAQLSKDSRLSDQMLGFLNLVHPKGTIGDTLILEVPDDLTREMIEHRAKVPILTALANTPGSAVSSFAVVINSALHTTPPPQPSSAPGRPDPQGSSSILSAPPTPETKTSSAPPPQESTPEDSSRLNPKYNFDNFVIGSSNRFAHAAAFAVAEAPAKAYNPLFIYGGSGLGKTHLLHAIGHYAISLYPGIRIRYVSSEEFTNDFINSIQNNQSQDFQARYRNIDILLIDDIQFLQGKDSTQEAFFHTFNTLHDHSKQVVITSDQPPRKLHGFEERMTSRFEWGLITDVQAPDLETRIAILRRKAASEHLDIPADVLEFIATKVPSNIRELEGTLLRVTAFASIEKQLIDIDLVQAALKDVITLNEDNIIAPTEIINHVARYYRLTPEDLTGASRAQQIALARQISMYLCREMTSLSLPKIGAEFGGRDHTTVMYANNKIDRLMRERRQIYTEVTDLMTEIKQSHR